MLRNVCFCSVHVGEENINYSNKFCKLAEKYKKVFFLETPAITGSSQLTTVPEHHSTDEGLLTNILLWTV